MPNSKTTKFNIIAVLSVKNEKNMVERWLKRTSEIVDGIIILDDGSTDKTPQIIKSHPKVIEIVTNSPNQEWKGRENRNRLLALAKSYNPSWILISDTDEILDKRVVSNLDNLIADTGIGQIFFKEITLWKNTREYRIDKPEMYNRSDGTCRLVRMNPNLKWILPADYQWKRRLYNSIKSFKFIKAPTAGIEKLIGVEGSTAHSDFVRIHYHFVDWDETWYKHMRYAVRDAIQFNKPLKELEAICQWGRSRLDESTLETAPIKPKWGVLD